MTTSTGHKPAGSLMLIAGILLISANMRAPITGIAPLLETIRTTFGLATTEAGALTTLPLLAFALTSPFAVLLAREYGLERSLFIALVMTAVGIALRSVGRVEYLFLGTAVIGVGIAIANVLLPSLLKRDFPHKVAAMTSAYALTAGLFAAIASSLAVPIATLPGSGWGWALGAIIVLPLAAMAVWLPQLTKHTAPAKGTATPPHGGRIWRSGLAWQVTLFLGCNSMIYYTVIAWLPTILTDAGYSTAAAGSLHGISQLATAAPGLFLGAIIGRLRDQRALAFGFAITTGLSVLGFVVFPQTAVIWAITFGCSSSAVFILGLAFVSMRAANAHQAAGLSAMAQFVGYLLAATAPPIIGLLHDRLDSWTAPLITCSVVCGVMAVIGMLAGRSRHIFEGTSLQGATVH
ncbi:MAG: MFS transporter [Bradyrhizobiaceae bacterium PARB1]|jgi:MFS transporter, CP family, cyanate transporter|nr:MAG: MFS transporter [Bradyrhizobiaceae bacterium PARB1]